MIRDRRVAVAGLMNAPVPEVDPRLAGLSDAAIALALGVCVGRRPKVAHTGRVSVLVDELRRRGVFDDLLATMDPQLVLTIRILDRADRGQRWARTGRR